jgi:hypothetical protein
LLLELEDFLRKRIDFCILFVDFFCQCFDLSRVSWLCSFRRRRLTRSGPNCEKEARTENRWKLHRAETLPLAELSGKHPLALDLVHARMRSLPFHYLLLDFFMPERIQKPAEPAPWGPKQGDGGGPRSPDISRPDTKDLLKKMRKVDPNQSKRYRQRTGQ